MAYHRVRSLLWPATITLASLALGAAWLDWSPPHLLHDEANFALHAQSIAASGRDLNGRLLPLYFEIPDLFWATPVCIYLAAAVLKIAPLTEVAVRLPSVIVGALDALLIYFIARRLFNSQRLGLLAAVLLALTPLHFIHARMLVDNIYPVPFVLGWLWGLTVFLDGQHRRWPLALGMFVLGCGFYSYHASVVTMPVYFALTLAALVSAGVRSRWTYAVTVSSFAVPLLALVPWLLAQPEHYAQHVRAFPIYNPRLNPFQGIRELLSYTSLTARSDVYWNYFSPSLLFLSGDTSVVNSTRQSGVFLAPMVVLIGAGLVAVLVARRTPMNGMLTATFLAAPLAAALSNESGRAARMSTILPAGILLAVVGTDWLWSNRRVWARATAGLAVAAIPVAFGLFYADYMGDYRVRYGKWFEDDLRGALETVIELDQRDAAPQIWLDADIPYVEAFWRFQLLKHDRPGLALRTILGDGRDERGVGILQTSSIIVSSIGRDLDAQLRKAPEFLRVHTIVEPDGRQSFAVYRKQTSP